MSTFDQVVCSAPPSRIPPSKQHATQARTIYLGTRIPWAMPIVIGC